MKVAIVHDWLVTNAGAEKVLRAILDLYPNADVFSLVDFLNERDRQMVLRGKYAKISFIQHLPLAKKYFRNYLPLFPRAIESLDLSGYDLVISSSWAVAKGVRKASNQLHICYCHTPIRYAWDLYDEYTVHLSQPKKWIVQKTLEYIREWDRATSHRVDHFVANSHFVRKRIERIYGRDATVIYPPVDITKFTLYTQKEDYYVTASRLVPYKKTRLIVEAFNAMPDKKLIVIGDGEELAVLRAIGGPNISFLGYQEDAALVYYLQRAKAFVYAAIEDFGIAPIEAMACGTPVVALGIGGTAETVIDGDSGVHFYEQSSRAIVEAVKRFERMYFCYTKVRQNSLRYTSFQENFRKFVEAQCENF